MNTNNDTADTQLASELIAAAARRLRVDGHIEIQQPASRAMREVPIGPVTVWLDHSAAMYRLYEGRGWSTAQVDSRVSSSDRAARAFALSVLGGKS